jgi:hypothetical protein
MWKLLSVASLMSLTACSTMHTTMQGYEQDVTITSAPTDARVTVNGAPQGETPARVRLDRRQSYTLRIEKAGYEAYERQVTKQVNPSTLGNAIFPPLFLLDVATGSWQAFPSEVHVPLVPRSVVRR